MREGTGEPPPRSPPVAGSPQHRTPATIWSALPPSSLHNYLVFSPFPRTYPRQPCASRRTLERIRCCCPSQHDSAIPSQIIEELQSCRDTWMIEDASPRASTQCRAQQLGDTACLFIHRIGMVGNLELEARLLPILQT